MTSIEESICRALQTTDVQLLVLSGEMIDSALGLDALKRFCAELYKKELQLLQHLGPGNCGRLREVPRRLVRYTGRQSVCQSRNGNEHRSSSVYVPTRATHFQTAPKLRRLRQFDLCAYDLPPQPLKAQLY
jgi:hypothetical protein